MHSSPGLTFVLYFYENESSIESIIILTDHRFNVQSKLKTCLDPEPAANEQATSWSDVETKCYKLKDCGAAFEVAKESEKQPPEFMCLLVEASRQLLLEKNKGE